MTPKKDGSFRVCGDYGQLNAITVPDRYPTPNLYDFASNICGSKVFSKLDFHKAYNQIPVAPEDVKKTALTTPFGLFEFLYMPFGLRNASQTFQRHVNKALGDLDFVFSYQDDILVFSCNAAEHHEHLRIVFARLKKYQFLLNLHKCVFEVEELEFLGYKINADGISPTNAKIEAIIHYPKPSTIVDLRRFLGMVNFYHRNLPKTADTQAPLNSYFVDSHKNDKREIKWTVEADQAFEKIKLDFANATLLVHPRIGAELRLVCDASDRSIGAALEQLSVDGRTWEPLAFYSRKLTPAQTRYSTYDRELLAIRDAIKHFCYYLEGRDFSVFTDHKPLIYAFMQNPEKASPRQSRQLAYIAQFTTCIKHISGSDNVVADCLSRIDAFSLPLDIPLKDLADLQKADEELQELLKTPRKDLSFKALQWGPDHTTVFCEISGNSIRPYIPTPLRRSIFDRIHNVAHSGTGSTDRQIRSKYIWPGLHRDVAKWCKSCLDCQQSKISRHIKFLPDHFVAPDGRFDHVHIDLIGPLPISEGCRFIVTMIDRFSRWVEAIPIPDKSAPIVARAFYDNWISRYGSPKILSSDQGSEFEATLFQSLLSLVGCQHIHTTPYHPAANGMIERWHRCLKASLMCHNDSNWTRSLSTVLLGLRSHVRPDTDASPAEFIFGTSLRLPGEFFLEGEFTANPRTFLEEFREYMRQVRPVPVTHNHKRRIFVHKNLYQCSHVWMRNMTAKSLERPYSGPYKVLSRPSDRIFNIDYKGSQKSVSAELLKPAFYILETPDQESSDNTQDNQSAIPNFSDVNTSLRNKINIIPNVPSPSCQMQQSNDTHIDRSKIKTYVNKKKVKINDNLNSVRYV